MVKDMPNDFNNKDCKNCPYCNGKHLNPPVNNCLPLSAELNDSNTLLIFQSPGFDEWTGNQGKNNHAPIISNKTSSTANRMRKSFERNETKRDSYDITEAVQCYPGKNISGRDKRPSITVIRCCSGHLAFDLGKNYEKVVVFGKVAETAVNLVFKADENLAKKYVGKIIFVPHPSSGLTNEELDKACKL